MSYSTRVVSLMRFSSKLLLAFLLSMFAFSMSCDQAAEEVKIEAVTITQPTAEMEIGETVQLRAIITPDNAGKQNIVWSSSRKSVATVTQDGLVTAVAEGISTIYASVGAKRGSCEVTVSKRFVPVSSVSIIPDELVLTEGEDYQLEIKIMPEDATDLLVTWESLDTKVAMVDGEGRVRAVKEGETVIKVSVGGKTANCKVVVNGIHVSSITLDYTELSVYIGRVLQLTATVNPADADYQSMEWSSTDNEVVTVTETGLMMAVGKGVATIKASLDGVSATCSVEVLVPVANISFEKSELSIYAGSQYSLALKPDPEDATFSKEVVWSSSDETTATVSNTGLIFAKKKGKAIIAAEVDGCKAICEVLVFDAITGVSFDTPAKTIHRGDKIKLTYNLEPNGAVLIGHEDWETSDNTVAIVDDDGTVTALKSGVADIKVSIDGGYSAVCRIIVIVPVESITLDKYYLDLKKKESYSLSALISPGDATNKEIEWKSSNTNVATVDNKGVVYASGRGTAIITASVGDLSATCTVVVTVPVSKITINNPSLTIPRGLTFQFIATISPSDANESTISWSSSDPSIAIVDNTGLMTALGSGIVRIRASIGDIYAESVVTIIVPVSSVTIDKQSVILFKGETVCLNASIEPEDATNKEIEWFSSNEIVASVKDGVVSANDYGAASIRAYAGGKYSSNCIVNVVESLALNRTKLKLAVQSSFTLSLLSSPEDLVLDVEWFSSDYSIAWVDYNTGRVEAKKVGNATITAMVGGKSFTCVVTCESLSGDNEGVGNEPWK